MTMNDIELYLSKSNDRKSAKEGKNLYESGHVSEVEFNNISDCLKFCYVRGKVVPQTRIGENPYTDLVQTINFFKSIGTFILTVIFALEGVAILCSVQSIIPSTFFKFPTKQIGV